MDNAKIKETIEMSIQMKKKNAELFQQRVNDNDEFFNMEQCRAELNQALGGIKALETVLKLLNETSSV